MATLETTAPMGFLRILLILLASLVMTSCQREKIADLDSRMAEVEEQLKVLNTIADRIEDLETSLETLKLGSRRENSAILATSLTLDDSFIDDPYLGEKSAPVTIIGFIDYQSRLARDFLQNTLPKLKVDLIDSGKVRFILVDFPLPAHTLGADAARAGQCAGEQGHYWRYFDGLIKKELTETLISDVAGEIPQLDKAKFERCRLSKKYEKELKLDIEAGTKLGLKGVPSFIVGSQQLNGEIKGVVIRGAQPYSIFAREVERIISEIP